MAVSTLVATVTTVFPVAGGSKDTHTWSSPPSFTLADTEGSNVAMTDSSDKFLISWIVDYLLH